jgi:hypothetical protein
MAINPVAVAAIRLVFIGRKRSVLVQGGTLKTPPHQACNATSKTRIVQ